MNHTGTKEFSVAWILNSSPVAILAVAIAYAVVAKVSFLFTIPPGNVSPIFPAAGIALAAAMILGRNALAGVWLGSFAANAISFFDGTVSPIHAVLPDLLIASFIGIGAMAGAGAGAFLVRRFCKDEHPLKSGWNVLMLVTVGALGCCMVSPTFGVVSLSLGGYIPWERFGHSWITWWAGDAAGAIVAAPLILAWHHPHPFRKNPWRIMEAAVLGGVTLLLCLFVFFRNVPFAYGLMPLLLWAAFRFGMRGASTAAAAIAILATIGTSHGGGPFVKDTVNESLLALHSFLDVTIICALFLAGILAERKRAEKVLQESETRHRFLFEHNPMPMLIYERGTLQMLAVNEAFIRHYGYRLEEVLALRLTDLYPEEEKAKIAELIPHLRGHANVGEWHHRKRDGSFITNLVSSHDLEHQGRSARVAVLTDITERKRAEEALRRSEEQFRLIMENLADLVAVLDLDGRRLYNSPSYQGILGDPDKLRGSSSFEQIHPEDRARVQQAFHETVRTGVGQRMEYRMMDQHGRIRHIESQGSVIRDAQGGVSQVVVVSRDITARREAERALRESEQKYRELVMLANSIILRWSRDGRITFLNEFGQRFFGYTEAEICGRHVVGTIVPASGSNGRNLPSLMDEISANPAAFEQNINENMRRNGEHVWIAWTNRVVRDERGQVAEILSIGTDITARKQVEEELRATQASLEERVLLRTTELAEARDRAESADRLKSAFLATMSHELRTPLNSIIGFTGIMLQGLAGPLNAEQTKQMGMVQGSARHLLALINDVLDISKIEAGQLEIHAEPFDLRASLEKVAALVKPMADKKGLALRVVLPQDVEQAVNDRLRVEQVLLNLLNNAVKFTERGAVTLAVETEPGMLRTPRSALRISVTDTGIGIKPEDMEKIFQPFRQIDSGLTRQHDGTGLGLTICRHLADLMGGEISAKSAWGEGSVFTFVLPLKHKNKP
ncbi:MAG: PAS domain S-box protein [Verrucomicrobiota bacterium]